MGKQSLDKLMHVVGWAFVALMALCVLAALIFVGNGIGVNQGWW